MPPLLQLQKLPGKGDGGWTKSVYVSFFGCPEDREFVEKKEKKKKRSVLGHPVARVIASCQAHSDYGPPKMPLKCWQYKIPIFANTDFDCEESTHRK